MDKHKDFLNIALKILHQKGFKAMTMRDLAKEMDCKVSNIYNYIKSKQALLDKVLFEISQKFHDGMEDIESSSYDSLDKLKAVIAMHVRLTVENPYQVQLLVSEWKHLDESRQKDFIAFRNIYEKRLRSILDQGVKDNHFDIEDIDFTMNCILSSIRWIYSHYSPSTDKKSNAFDIEKKLTTFILKGIAV